jgi:hypothetical protein
MFENVGKAGLDAINDKWGKLWQTALDLFRKGLPMETVRKMIGAAAGMAGINTGSSVVIAAKTSEIAAASAEIAAASAEIAFTLSQITVQGKIFLVLMVPISGLCFAKLVNSAGNYSGITITNWNYNIVDVNSDEAPKSRL